MARVHATSFEISLKMNCGGASCRLVDTRGKAYAGVGKIYKLPCWGSSEHNRRCFVIEVETIISLICNVAAQVSVYTYPGRAAPCGFRLPWQSFTAIWCGNGQRSLVFSKQMLCFNNGTCMFFLMPERCAPTGRIAKLIKVAGVQTVSLLKGTVAITLLRVDNHAQQQTDIYLRGMGPPRAESPC